MQHIVMFSGGAGSYITAKRVAERIGAVPTLLFADTLIEDAGLYDFLIRAAANIGGLPDPRLDLSGMPDINQPIE